MYLILGFLGINVMLIEIVKRSPLKSFEEARKGPNRNRSRGEFKISENC
jgi:hypothetical protein